MHVVLALYTCYCLIGRITGLLPAWQGIKIPFIFSAQNTTEQLEWFESRNTK